MRIGIFTDTYLPYVSGLVTSELMLKKSLEAMGHEVFVVTANLEGFQYEYDEEAGYVGLRHDADNLSGQGDRPLPLGKTHYDRGCQEVFGR